jgi:tetratricopeptide (TPR) repeat protein
MSSGFGFFFGSTQRRDAFRWRIDRDDTPTVLRDLSWDFAEPDEYPALVAQQKPGFTASKAEKALHDAIATGDPSEIVRVAGQNPKYAAAGNVIAGLLFLETMEGYGIEILQGIVDRGDNIEKDHFVHKYLPEAGLSVVIAEGLMVRLPLSRTAVMLLLAELYQSRDRIDDSLQVLGSAEATTHVRLSKAELYLLQGRFDEVIAATEAVVNDDDITALLLAYRGRALHELGRNDEALSTFARVLEYPNRAAAVKALALIGRGTVHQSRGELILAENDFTQALVEIPGNPEARLRIEQLIRSPGEEGGT